MAKARDALCHLALCRGQGRRRGQGEGPALIEGGGAVVRGPQQRVHPLTSQAVLVAPSPSWEPPGAPPVGVYATAWVRGSRVRIACIYTYIISTHSPTSAAKRDSLLPRRRGETGLRSRVAGRMPARHLA